MYRLTTPSTPKRNSIALGCAILIATTAAAQLPAGGAVTAGKVQINQNGTTQTIVQTSDKAIIDWRAFSVGPGNSVVFAQPAASSVTLNRVVGTDKSNILGSVSANGQFFLVNPNGIFFGANSVLDASGVVVSTLDIRNEDFLSGRYVFSRSPQQSQTGITNAGALRARDGGYVFIAGEQVSNLSTGSISAPAGVVGVAAAGQVTLDLQGDKLLNFSVDRGVANTLVGVDNLGAISADGGRVWITAAAARGVAGAVLNNAGVIRAAGVEEHEGQVTLTAVNGSVRLDGSVDVSGARAGAINVSANTIDVSGTAQLRADGVDFGGGGRIVLIAEDRTTSNGQLSAKGGALGGAGGFVETSARNFLNVSGTRVNTSALNGAYGEWLLDPLDITIRHGAATGIVPPAGSFAASSTILDGDINSNLATTNVTISTAGAGGDAGTILVSGTADAGGGVNIVGTNGRDLSLIANAGITLRSGSIINLGSTSTGGNLLLQAGAGVTQVAGSQILANGLSVRGTGAFDLGSSADIRQNKVGVVAANVTGAFSLSNVNADPGSILQIGSVGGVSGITTAGADISIYNDSTGGLSVNSAVTTGSASAAKITLQTSEATTTGSQTLSLNADVTAGQVKLLAADDVLQSSGIISANNLVVKYAEGANPDGVTLGQANVVGTLAAAVMGSGAGVGNAFIFKNAQNAGITIGASGGIFGIVSKGGNVTLTADALEVAQPIDVRGTPSASVFIAPSNNSTTIKLGSEVGGSLSLTQAELNSIRLGASGVLRVGSKSTQGGIELTGNLSPTVDLMTLSLKTAGSITQAAGTSLSFKALAIESGTGAISLNNSSMAPGVVSAKTQGEFRYNFGSGAGADLTIDALDGVDGIHSSGSLIALASSGAMVVNKAVDAGVGSPISITAAGAGFSQKSGAAITASGLRLAGSGTFVLADPLNTFQTIAASIAGNLEVSSAVPLNVGSVTVGTNTTTGITTAGGNAKLASDQLTITSPVSTAGGTVTLRALSAATVTELGTLNKGTLGKLELSAVEVGRINTGTGGLTIGDSSIDGALSIVGAFNLAGTGPLTFVNGNGGIAVKQKLSYGGSVALSTDGSVGDMGGVTGISASSIIISSKTGVSLRGSGNNVSSLTLDNTVSGTVMLANASTALSVLSMSQTGGGDIGISNTGTLELTATPITAVGSNLSLSSGGGMRLLKGIDVGSNNTVLLRAGSGGVFQGGGNIIAGGLELKGLGAFSLANFESTTSNNSTAYSYNDVGTIAADITGNLTYREKNGLTVGSVGTTTGINTHGGSLTLESGGPQQTGNVVLTPFGGPLILGGDLTAGSGLITLFANNSGTVGISQAAGKLSAASLNVKSDGAVTLSQSANHVDNIAVQAKGAVSIKDSGATTINGEGLVSGGGPISIETGGLLSITQTVNAGSGDITFVSGAGVQQTAGAVGQPGQPTGGFRGGKLLLQGNGPFTLTNGDNKIGTLAGSFQGDLAYLNAGAMTVGSVAGVSGVTSTNAGTIDIRTVAGSLTVNQGVYSAPSGARGDVSLVAGGTGSVLALNADVRGANVRLNSEGTIQQSPGSFIDALSLSLGAKNNALAAVPNRSNTPIDELILYFDGVTISNEDYFLTNGPSISRLVLYGQSAGSSFQLGGDKRILATNLLLTGFGSYNLTNAGNDVDTLAVLRPWGSSAGQNVSYSDVNGFDVGKISWNSTLSFTTSDGAGWTWPGNKLANGIQNNGVWPQLGFGGVGGDIRLVAGGTGLIKLESPIVTGGLVSISAGGGVTEGQGVGIISASLKLAGQGAFKLDGPNIVGSLAASLSNSGGVTFVSSGNVDVTTVDGISGIQVSGPGATNISVRSTNGKLSINQEVRSVADLGASVKSSAATISLRSYGDSTISANVNAQGGATSTGDSAVIRLRADVGGVTQTSGLISVTDLGGATPTAQSPHRSLVEVRAGANSLDAGTAISGSSGRVTLNNVSANAGAGSAAIDVYGPGGINVAGPITVTAQTAPRVNITSDIQDGDKKLKSSMDISISGAITVSQPGGSDVNKRAETDTAGLLVSGQNILNSGVLSTNGDYGISMFAQGNMDIRANINTTSIAGVALSTGAKNGRVTTSDSVRINAKQLALVGGRDKGIFNLTTNVENLQVLGARSVVVDNSAFSSELLAVLGRVSEATTDPLTGTAIPASDSPVGAISVTTGGQLTILALNNQSGSSYNLAGSGISGRRPLILIADALVETPGTFKVDPNTEVTLRPYTAGRPIIVRNLPDAVPDLSSTYYLAGFVGVLAQLDGGVRLVIGGDDYTGNISVGNQIAGGLFPVSEQFSLGNMEILFATKGRVYNRFNFNPDYPINWSTGALLSAPYKVAPDIFCAVGSACIAKISKGKIYVKDSLSNGDTQRNIVFQGTGDGSGATSIPPTGGNNNNNGSDDSSSSPGSSDSGSSGTTGAPSDGAPTGGGNNGTPEDVVKTEISKTNLNPTAIIDSTIPVTGDAGSDTTSLDDLSGDLAPDGGNSGPNGGSQFAGSKEGAGGTNGDFDPVIGDEGTQSGETVFSGGGTPNSGIGDALNDGSFSPNLNGGTKDVSELIGGKEIDTQNGSGFSDLGQSSDFLNGGSGGQTGLADGSGTNFSDGFGGDGIQSDLLGSAGLSGGGSSGTGFSGAISVEGGALGDGGGSALGGSAGGDFFNTGAEGGTGTGFGNGASESSASDLLGSAGLSGGGDNGIGFSGASSNEGGGLSDSGGAAFGGGAGGDLFNAGAEGGTGTGFGNGASEGSANDLLGSAGLSVGGNGGDFSGGVSGEASEMSGGGSSGFASGVDAEAGFGSLTGSGTANAQVDGGSATSLEGLDGANLLTGVGGGSLSSESDGDSLGGVAAGSGGNGTNGRFDSSGEFALALDGGSSGDYLANANSLEGASGGGALSTDGSSGGNVAAELVNKSNALDSAANDASAGANGSGLSGQSQGDSGAVGIGQSTDVVAMDLTNADGQTGGQSSGLSGGRNETTPANSGTQGRTNAIPSDFSDDSRLLASNDKRASSSSNANRAARQGASTDDVFACVADRNQETKALRAKAGKSIISVKGTGVRLARGSCGDAGGRSLSN